MGDPVSISQLRQLLHTRWPRARTGFAVRTPGPVVATGVRRLDALLGGGLPGGETTELVGVGLGSGSVQVIHALLRQAAGEGRFTVLIDGADSLDVDALSPAVLARVLWVRCRQVAEALAATDLVLRDRNFPLVILDLKLNAVAEWRGVAGGVWHRLNRLREQHRATLLVVTPRPLVGAVSRRVQVSGARVASGLTLGPGRLGLEHRDRSLDELLEALDFEVLRGVGVDGVTEAGAESGASAVAGVGLGRELRPVESGRAGERFALTG